MATEIERKFLVDQPPSPSELGDGEAMRQGYLAGEGDVEVRLRITASEAVLAVKAGRGMSRTEVETRIPSDEAEALWPHTAGRSLDKVRHRVGLGSHVAEVDVYGGSLEGLLTVEVEFGDEADAVAFVPPDWFGRELTNDGGWTNASLARRGRPDT